MRKQYLEIGKIVSTHGIQGEVRVQPWCDSAQLLAEMETLYYDDKGKQDVRILSGRVHKNIVILKIDGVTTIEAAQLLRNRILYVDREELELEEGSYFIQDLIGLTVTDADSGIVYGRLTDVFQTGANDVYEVTEEGGNKRLIPAIPDVVVKTDIDGGIMTIRPLKGLFDDAD